MSSRRSSYQSVTSVQRDASLNQTRGYDDEPLLATGEPLYVASRFPSGEQPSDPTSPTHRRLSHLRSVSQPPSLDFTSPSPPLPSHVFRQASTRRRDPSSGHGHALRPSHDIVLGQTEVSYEAEMIEIPLLLADQLPAVDDTRSPLTPTGRPWGTKPLKM